MKSEDKKIKIKFYPDESKKLQRENSERFKKSSALIRLMNDLKNHNFPKNSKIEFLRKGDFRFLLVNIIPSYGPLKKYQFSFVIHFSFDYPFSPPIVRAKEKYFHPSIDINGRVCMNILLLDWLPSYNVLTIILGLDNILSEPSSEDPMNKDAAFSLSKGLDNYKKEFNQAANGKIINGIEYSKLTKLELNKTEK